MNTCEKIKGDIDSFVLLEDNWDGYNAIPLFASIAEKAKIFIASISDDLIDRISDMYPNVHGTLTIEWENNKMEKLSLEIGENNYSYFVIHTNRKPKLVDAKNSVLDIEDITKELEKLFVE